MPYIIDLHSWIDNLYNDKMNRIVTKKQYIEFLQKELKDDEPIIFSNTLDGTAKVVKRRSLQTYPVAFGHDYFKGGKRVGLVWNPIRERKKTSTILGMLVCQKEDLSEEALRLFTVERGKETSKTKGPLADRLEEFRKKHRIPNK